MKIIKIAASKNIQDNLSVLEISVTNINKSLIEISTHGAKIIGTNSINMIKTGIINNIQNGNFSQFTNTNVDSFLSALAMISNTLLRINQALNNIKNDPDAAKIDTRLLIDEVIKGLNNESVQFQGMLAQFNAEMAQSVGTQTNIIT